MPIGYDLSALTLEVSCLLLPAEQIVRVKRTGQVQGKSKGATGRRPLLTD